MRWLWNAADYWPAWLITATGTFLLREIWALVSDHPGDTLSEWVWRILKITRHEPMANWDAADFLVFGVWVTLVVWLTYHFFWHQFG